MILVISSCQQKPDFGKALSRKFNNPSLKHLSLEEVAPFLEKKLLKARNTETGTLLAAGYHNRSYTPVFLQRYLPGNGMELLLEHINAAGEHGLDPVIFRPNRLLELMDTLQNRKALATPEATAEMVAELELQLAGTLARYSNALLFGITNPSKIYPRYYTDTGRPDSASMDRLFNTREQESWIDSIHTVRPEYLFLPKNWHACRNRLKNQDRKSGGGEKGV